MKITSISFLLLTLCLSCSKELVVLDHKPINKDIAKFIGSWSLESTLIDGVEQDIDSQIMTIEQDDNIFDSTLKGHIEFGTESTREELTMNFTEIEDQVLMIIGTANFTCTFSFVNADDLIIDDSSTAFTYINSWKRF